MSKDNEIKISLNLEKLVKESKQNEQREVNKKEINVFEKDELEKINEDFLNSKKETKKEEKRKITNPTQKKSKVKDNKNEELEDSIKILKKHNNKLEEERKPRIGKTLNEVKKEKIEQIEDEKIKKLTIKNIITSIIVLIIIIFIYLLIEYAPILGIRLPSNLSKEISVDLISSDSDIYDKYNDELLVYSNHNLSTYNKKGKKTWEYSIDTSFNPNIYIHGNYMAVSNNSNGVIYLFNNKREILNMKVDGKIEYIYMDDYGNMAVEYATNSYKKIIGIYDKKGKNKYNTYIEYNAIVDIILLDDADKLLIVQADSNSFKIGCSINLLDTNSSEKNMQQILKLDNSFIYDVKKINNSLFLLLNDKIIEFDMDKLTQKDVKEFNSSQMLFVSLMDKYYVSIEKSLSNDNMYNIVTNDYNNVEISTVNINNAPKFVVNSDYLNYCIYQNKLQIMNKWGIEVVSKNLSMVPKDIIIFNNSKSAALIYTNKIEIINL